MQAVLIAASFILAVAFSLSYWRWPVRQPRLLLAGAAILYVVGAYEAYMHVVWEPSVHAPIRLDIFVIDLPLLVLGVLVGLSSMIGRRAPPDVT